MSADEVNLDVAHSVIQRWGHEPVDIRLLSRSENTSWAVTIRNGTRLVLRLHRPGYNTLAELESEVTWVRSLDSAGVPVPETLTTSDGVHHVEVELDGRPRYACLIRWVDGRPARELLEARPTDVASWYRRIGLIAAQIRTHNSTWEPPPSFTRRRWDAEGLVGDRPLWGTFWDRNVLDGIHRELFTAARRRLRDEIADFGTDASRFGLIHADLHPGNLIIDRSRMTLIDFDDAGFGYYTHELAVALHPLIGTPWFDEAKRSMLEGYAEVHELDAEEEASLDAFGTIRSLMLVGWLCDRPELQTPTNLHSVITRAGAAARRYLSC